MVADILGTGCDVHVLRDPTRGGVGTTLNEIAGQSRAGIRIHEDRLPVRPDVSGVCELLGFDPLYVANEGKCLAVVDGKDAGDIVELMKQQEEGREAVIIGRLEEGSAGRVLINTPIGGSRVITPLHGHPLPRIC